jgi:hypothetical protein
MDDLTHTQREIHLKMREDNLKTMQELTFAEHVAHTETIKKVSKQIIAEMTAAGHVCVQGERMVRLETKIDTILDNQTKIQEHIDSLFTGRNENSKRIDRIETIGMIMGTLVAGSWAVFIWLAEKVTWK